MQIFLHTKFVSGPAWLQGKVEQLLLDQPQLTVIIDYFIEKRVLDEFYCLLCEVTSSSSMDPWFADQHKSADVSSLASACRAPHPAAGSEAAIGKGASLRRVDDFSR